jgi:hypothetical protein
MGELLSFLSTLFSTHILFSCYLLRLCALTLADWRLAILLFEVAKQLTREERPGKKSSHWAAKSGRVSSNVMVVITSVCGVVCDLHLVQRAVGIGVIPALVAVMGRLAPARTAQCFQSVWSGRGRCSFASFGQGDVRIAVVLFHRVARFNHF